MDGLDLLKKDWKKREGNIPQLSYDQIYQMLWKRSSSIVKWIFVISIIEFLFWALINLFMADKDYWNQIDRLHLKEFTIATYIINYAITFFFIYCFYKNYRKISATDNASKLMENILRTRKTVKYYIGYVLISTALTSLIFLYLFMDFHMKNTVVEDIEEYSFSPTQWLMFVGIMIGIFAIFLGLIWLFYRVVYGILLRRLNKNYKQLKKLEV
ncbi:membrane protein [Salegentibacter sp. Hel_I_6]|uniref:membrane protein n=1 Tax=Salegentibacter sp. Hel_I_6 TaxID=1250278 RepID=UPI00055E335F|nr:membrane protein [Salegentibacter sp. Hel_I_6]